jgi:outer membrane receptor protein involved in Fe transport
MAAALTGASTAAEASSAPPSQATDSTPVQGVVVTGKKTDSLGTAISASAGVVGGVELSQRPILRQGELLEAVPGMIVTAHTSGGKANQYYLRGFNLDHGTDFATFVEGVPVNLGTHAHGQGYMDLNWLIPELVSGITFRKGNYDADVGDFASAGSARISYVDKLPSNVLTVEGGTDNYGRALFAGSAPVGPGTLLYAGEYMYYDGPYLVPGRYKRPNGLLKYSVGDETTGGSVTLQLYEAQWYGSDQVPVQAIEDGLPGGRYGSLDPTSGGSTHRYNLGGEWHWVHDNVANKVEVYAFQYGLNLYSDFTDFIDQAHGDQIRQYDNRYVVGASGSTTISGHYLGQETADAFGLQTRNDFVTTELDHTEDRVILQDYRRDQTTINSVSLWWSNTIVWTPKLRTELGFRFDLYHFNLDSNMPANSGETTAGRPEPKIGVTYSPNPRWDLYAQAGISERSNDARGIFDRAPSYPGGPAPTESSKPLVRSEGAEVGTRVRSLAGLTSTLAIWYLQSNSELFFAGDSGADEDSDRPGQRYGVEFNNIYAPLAWLTIDADVAVSRAYFTDHDTVVGDRIPEAINSSISASAILHDIPGAKGFTASVRLRYFGPRDLIENGTQHSAPVTVVNARLGYDLTEHVSLGLEVLNLLDTAYNDAEYYDSYRLFGQPRNPDSPDGSYMGHVIHAGEPREIRGSVTYRF